MNQFPTPDPRVLAELYGPPLAIDATLRYLLARRDHLTALIITLETEHKLHGQAQTAAKVQPECV